MGNKELKEKIKAEGNYKKFEYKGFTCLIQRKNLDYLCGYIKIPEDHFLYGETITDKIDNLGVNFHGGCTFADWSNEIFKDDNFYIGFDCGHAGDKIPELNIVNKIDYGIYRDMKFVENNLIRAVDILSEKGKTSAN